MTTAKRRSAKPRSAKRRSTRPTTAKPGSGKPRRQRQPKPFMFRDRMRLELAALADSDPTAVRALAQRLWAKAAKGGHGLAAIKEIANLLDGPPPAAPKPPKDDPSERIDRIERVIVNPPARPDDPVRARQEENLHDHASLRPGVGPDAFGEREASGQSASPDTRISPRPSNRRASGAGPG